MLCMNAAYRDTGNTTGTFDYLAAKGKGTSERILCTHTGPQHACAHIR